MKKLLAAAAISALSLDAAPAFAEPDNTALLSAFSVMEFDTDKTQVAGGIGQTDEGATGLALGLGHGLTDKLHVNGRVAYGFDNGNVDEEEWVAGVGVTYDLY